MKPYGLKELGAKLVAKGLPVAEEAADQTWEAVKEWLVESAQASGNKVDDVIIAVIPIADSFVKQAIDNISSED